MQNNSAGWLRQAISLLPCTSGTGRLLLACCLPALCLVGPSTYAAEDPAASEQGLKVYEIESTEVRAEKPATVSSDQLIRDKDFLNFPNQTPPDLLRIMPGIFINQHTGGARSTRSFSEASTPNTARTSQASSTEFPKEGFPQFKEGNMPHGTDRRLRTVVNRRCPQRILNKDSVHAS